MNKIRTFATTALLILTFTWGAAMLGGHDTGGHRAYGTSSSPTPITAHITYSTTRRTLPNGDYALQEDDPEIVHNLLTCRKAGIADCHLERDTDGQLRVYGSKWTSDSLPPTR